MHDCAVKPKEDRPKITGYSQGQRSSIYNDEPLRDCGDIEKRIYIAYLEFKGEGAGARGGGTKPAIKKCPSKNISRFKRTKYKKKARGRVRYDR